MEEPKVWLLSLCARVTELSVDLEALPDAALVEIPLLSIIFIGISTMKRSEETLGWWTSMAVVVMTQKAPSGTPLSVCEEVKG